MEAHRVKVAVGAAQGDQTTNIDGSTGLDNGLPVYKRSRRLAGRHTQLLARSMHSSVISSVNDQTRYPDLDKGECALHKSITRGNCSQSMTSSIVKDLVVCERIR